MKVAISQPTFVPWQGYFALIDYVDEFVFLDNVQFEKRSWQQRNYIKVNDAKKIFTIPVDSKNKSKQKINEVLIDYKNFKVEKFLMLLRHNYKKSNYFDLYYEKIKKILNKNTLFLSDLNQDLIKNICLFLKISTSFYKASSFKLNKDLKNMYLLRELCKKKNCTKYISTVGASTYMGNLKKFPDTKIEIKFFEYHEKKYNQIGNKNISNLSVLDILFNEGPNSLDFIRSSFKII